MLTEIQAKNMTTDELLRYVDQSNPEVRELVERLAIYLPFARKQIAHEHRKPTRRNT